MTRRISSFAATGCVEKFIKAYGAKSLIDRAMDAASVDSAPSIHERRGAEIVSNYRRNLRRQGGMNAVAGASLTVFSPMLTLLIWVAVIGASTALTWGLGLGVGLGLAGVAVSDASRRVRKSRYRGKLAYNMLRRITDSSRNQRARPRQWTRQLAQLGVFGPDKRNAPYLFRARTVRFVPDASAIQSRLGVDSATAQSIHGLLTALNQERRELEIWRALSRTPTTDEAEFHFAPGRSQITQKRDAPREVRLLASLDNYIETARQGVVDPLRALFLLESDQFQRLRQAATHTGQERPSRAPHPTDTLASLLENAEKLRSELRSDAALVKIPREEFHSPISLDVINSEDSPVSTVCCHRYFAKQELLDWHYWKRKQGERTAGCPCCRVPLERARDAPEYTRILELWQDAQNRAGAEGRRVSGDRPWENRNRLFRSNIAAS